MAMGVERLCAEYAERTGALRAARIGDASLRAQLTRAQQRLEELSDEVAARGTTEAAPRGATEGSSAHGGAVYAKAARGDELVRSWGDDRVGLRAGDEAARRGGGCTPGG